MPQQQERKKITKIIIYSNSVQMTGGIRKMQGEGWEVEHSEAIAAEYGCAKTACLGCIFLPLALLGKKPQKYKVTFVRYETIS